MATTQQKENIVPAPAIEKSSTTDPTTSKVDPQALQLQNEHAELLKELESLARYRCGWSRSFKVTGPDTDDGSSPPVYWVGELFLDQDLWIDCSECNGPMMIWSCLDVETKHTLKVEDMVDCVYRIEGLEPFKVIHDESLHSYDDRDQIEIKIDKDTNNATLRLEGIVFHHLSEFPIQGLNHSSKELLTKSLDRDRSNKLSLKIKKLKDAKKILKELFEGSSATLDATKIHMQFDMNEAGGDNWDYYEQYKDSSKYQQTSTTNISLLQKEIEDLKQKIESGKRCKLQYSRKIEIRSFGSVLYQGDAINQDGCWMVEYECRKLTNLQQRGDRKGVPLLSLENLFIIVEKDITDGSASFRVNDFYDLQCTLTLNTVNGDLQAKLVVEDVNQNGKQDNKFRLETRLDNHIGFKEERIPNLQRKMNPMGERVLQTVFPFGSLRSVFYNYLKQDQIYATVECMYFHTDVCEM